MCELERDISELDSLRTQLAKANERCAELQKQLEDGIFEASCYDVDVIRCLNKMAYEHNEKEIPRFRDMAKRCAERISKRTSDLNKFAIEQKVEALDLLKRKAVESIHRNWIVNPMNGVESPGVDELMRKSVGLNTTMIDSLIEQLRKEQNK